MADRSLPARGRWWKQVGLVLALLGLADLALAVSDWIRLISGHAGVWALGGGVFLSVASVGCARASLSAFIHARHGDPKPEERLKAILGGLKRS
jgi:hypothetical protein